MWVIGLYNQRKESEMREYKISGVLDDYKKPFKMIADRRHSYNYNLLITKSLYKAKLFETKEQAEELIFEKEKEPIYTTFNQFYYYKNYKLRAIEISDKKLDYIKKRRESEDFSEDSYW
jgi:hypothetical protein